MLDIPKIRAVLDTASRWDMDLAQFACWGHAHLFNPVLPLEELAAWEELMQVTLPEDYRTYLTRLGNGGAGPAYGLSPLCCPVDEVARYLPRPCIYSQDQEEKFQDVLRRFIHWYGMDDDWALYLEYFPDAPHLGEEKWQRPLYRQWSGKLEAALDEAVVNPLLHYGQYMIANEGCAGDVYLILNGSHRGYVHCSTTDCDPDLAYPEPRTFAAYQADYLRETFADYFMSYVDRTEDVCRNLSGEKRRRFQRERAQVRDFYAAVQAQDWSGMVRLLHAIDSPGALSRKSQSFYRCYEETLLEQFPGSPEVERFFGEMFGPQDKYHMGRDLVTFQYGEAEERDLYPKPTFEAFVQTFFDP